jgi:hypothetical protein
MLPTVPPSSGIQQQPNTRVRLLGLLYSALPWGVQCRGVCNAVGLCLRCPRQHRSVDPLSPAFVSRWSVRAEQFRAAKNLTISFVLVYKNHAWLYSLQRGC